jgi:hypothetical protein
MKRGDRAAVGPDGGQRARLRWTGLAASMLERDKRLDACRAGRVQPFREAGTFGEDRVPRCVQAAANDA